MQTIRKCTQCSIEKEESVKNFRLRPGFVDRFNSWCRACESTHSCKKVKNKYHSDPEYRDRVLKDSSKRSKKRYREDHEFRKALLVKNRKVKLLSRYKISEQEYDNMLYTQNFICKICKNKDNRRLAVDHNHVSGKVRGLLCRFCNTALGLFKDSPELLRDAAKYVEEN